MRSYGYLVVATIGVLMLGSDIVGDERLGQENEALRVPRIFLEWMKPAMNSKIELRYRTEGLRKRYEMRVFQKDDIRVGETLFSLPSHMTVTVLRLMQSTERATFAALFEKEEERLSRSSPWIVEIAFAIYLSTEWRKGEESSLYPYLSALTPEDTTESCDGVAGFGLLYLSEHRASAMFGDVVSAAHETLVRLRRDVRRIFAALRHLAIPRHRHLLFSPSASSVGVLTIEEFEWAVATVLRNVFAVSTRVSDGEETGRTVAVSTAVIVPGFDALDHDPETTPHDVRIDPVDSTITVRTLNTFKRGESVRNNYFASEDHTDVPSLEEFVLRHGIDAIDWMGRVPDCVRFEDGKDEDNVSKEEEKKRVFLVCSLTTSTNSHVVDNVVSRATCEAIERRLRLLLQNSIAFSSSTPSLSCSSLHDKLARLSQLEIAILKRVLAKSCDGAGGEDVTETKEDAGGGHDTCVKETTSSSRHRVEKRGDGGDDDRESRRFVDYVARNALLLPSDALRIVAGLHGSGQAVPTRTRFDIFEIVESERRRRVDAATTWAPSLGCGHAQDHASSPHLNILSRSWPSFRLFPKLRSVAYDASLEDAITDNTSGVDPSSLPFRLSPSGKWLWIRRRMPLGIPMPLPCCDASDGDDDRASILFSSGSNARDDDDDDAPEVAMLFERSKSREADYMTWMSISPMEILTQQPLVDAAKGRVVICGLGMGWMLSQVMRRGRAVVSEVVLIEIDRELVDWILPRLEKEQTRAAAAPKLRIVVGDAFEELPRLDGYFDIVIVDIFETYSERREENRAAVEKLRSACRENAGRVVGWGIDDLRDLTNI
eukprot:g3351.t1